MDEVKKPRTFYKCDIKRDIERLLDDLTVAKEYFKDTFTGKNGSAEKNLML